MQLVGALEREREALRTELLQTRALYGAGVHDPELQSYAVHLHSAIAPEARPEFTAFLQSDAFRQNKVFASLFAVKEAPILTYPPGARDAAAPPSQPSPPPAPPAAPPKINAEEDQLKARIRANPKDEASKARLRQILRGG